MDSYINPLVSIIIPTYKRAHMLEKAINSILNQSYTNIEILVIDDNNEDSFYRIETAKFMEQYRDYSNIRYIKHAKNKGGSEARNTGINYAKGEYISFLDDDDLYYPSKIEKQLDIFFNSKLLDLGFVYCQMDFFNENERFIKKSKKYFRGNKEAFEANILNTIAGTPSIMAKKSVLHEIGGFKDLKSGQDWNLIMEMLDKGYQTDFLKENLVKVYIHNEERVSTNPERFKTYQERLAIKQKYFSKINKRLRSKVFSNYYLYLSHHYNTFNKKVSLMYLLKALKYQKVRKSNLICLLGILEPIFLKKIRKKGK